MISLNINTATNTSVDSIDPYSDQQINLTQFLMACKKDWTKACFTSPNGNISYGRFDTEIRRIASSLSDQGISPRQRVAISLDDSVELAAIFFANLAIGSVPLIINPNLDSETLAHILHDCAPTLLFGKSSNRDQIQHAIENISLPLRVAFADVGTLATGKASWISDSADSTWNNFYIQGLRDLAFIQYTSGTTGRAKGVMHSALSVLASCSYFAEAQLGLTSDDILYSVPKAFFGYGMGNSLFFPLYLGATSLLDSRWPTSATVVENIKRFSPSVLFAVPTLYRKLLDDDLQPQDCAIRLGFSAGAPLSEQIHAAWHARFGFNLHDGIGMTELCHVFATTYPHAMRTGSVGHMVRGFRHKIVDQFRVSVETGEIGVLHVAAPCSSIGYWNNPTDTAAKFKDGWWCTGDLFSEDKDGFLYFHGREDDRFKVFGRWLVPLEIERLVISRFPEISEAFVVPGCDVYGENRPALFLCSNEADIGRLATLTTAVISENLESFKKPVLCLPLPEIPYTSSGKVNRHELSLRASAALAHIESQQHKLEARPC